MSRLIRRPLPDASSPDLRLGRRRQVHPDRADALREKADLRRPAFDARARFEEVRHNRGRYRLCAAGRRARGRTRTGHHHDRRSPIVISSPPKGARSSSPIRPVTSNSPATWRSWRVQCRSRDCAGRRARDCSRRPIAIRSSFRCLASATSCLRSTRSTFVDFSETVFRQIEAAEEILAETLGFRSLIALPISARHGDNVSALSAAHALVLGAASARRSGARRGRGGPPKRALSPARSVDQSPASGFRGFAGAIPSGRVARGDRVVAADSGRQSTVAEPFGRRPRGRGRRGGRRDHGNAGRRDRHRPGRRRCRAPTAVRGRRSVHGDISYG